MKHKHYTNEEILEISKLLSEGRTYREIATMLNRDYTRLTRKINELGLYRFKKTTPKILKEITPKISKKTIPRTREEIRSDKIEYYNNKVNLYFNGRVKL